MARYILLLLSCFILNISWAQSQYEMNRDAYDASAKADSELNAVYKAILIDYSDDTEFITNLKIAQRIWLQFREAEINAKFPKRDDLYWYGSMHPMCLTGYTEQLTRERTKKLKEWLATAIEGDGCNGSVKRRY